MKLVRKIEQLCGGFPEWIYTDIYQEWGVVNMRDEFGAYDGQENRTITYYAVAVPRLSGKFNVLSLTIKQVHAKDCEKPYQEDFFIARRNVSLDMAIMKLRELEERYKKQKGVFRSSRQPFTKRHF